MLLSSGNVFTLRQILEQLFCDSASFENAGLRVQEAPFPIDDIPIVCGLLTQIARGFDIDAVVCATSGCQHPHASPSPADQRTRDGRALATRATVWQAAGNPI